jgi:peptidoglycan/xylan/chitin deacetylase (PgdA/CDA1 family)
MSLRRAFIWFALVSLVPAGCAGTRTAPPLPVVSKDPRVLAKTQKSLLLAPMPGDTYASLAAAYLGDARKAWLLEKANKTPAPVPGEPLLAPLSPPWRGGVSRSGYQRVPVLLYHNFSKRSSSGMTISEAKFDQQMRYLKEHGHTTLTLDEFYNFIENKAPAPPKSVLITIDDGWRNTWSIALPILEKHGHKAVLFIYSDFVGKGGGLSWDRLRDLEKRGVTIESHTKSHREVAVQSPGESLLAYTEALAREITVPHEAIQANLGRAPGVLAYPYGGTNRFFTGLLRQMGYRGAMLAANGSNPFFLDPFRVGRTAVHGEWSMDTFIRFLKTFEEADIP